MRRIVLGKHQMAILELLDKYSDLTLGIDYMRKKLSLSRSYVFRTCLALWKYNLVFLEPWGRARISNIGKAEVNKRTNK